MPASTVSQLRSQAAFRWAALLSEHRPLQVGTVAVREAMEMAAATAQAAAGTVTAEETATAVAAAEETATVQEHEVTVVIALSAD
jgi:predicted alternative tryptophan synthase beta-subunit